MILASCLIVHVVRRINLIAPVEVVEFWEEIWLLTIISNRFLVSSLVEFNLLHKSLKKWLAMQLLCLFLKLIELLLLEDICEDRNFVDLMFWNNLEIFMELSDNVRRSVQSNNHFSCKPHRNSTQFTEEDFHILCLWLFQHYTLSQDIFILENQLGLIDAISA